MKKFISIALTLTFSVVITLFAQNNFRYVTANLNMRMEPNTSSRVLLTIPKGTLVQINEDCDCQWIPIIYNGYVGYISTKYLSRNQRVSNEVSIPKQPIKYYTNSFGNRVQSPTYYSSPPAGATALCRDGTYSFSQSRRGTCSHHGGVARWLK